MTAIMSALSLQPDLAAIETYVDVVFSFLEGTVAVRIFPEKGDARVGDKRFIRTPFLTTGPDLARKILEIAKAAARDRLACYVIPGITRGHGRAGAGDIVSIQTILADLDEGDIAAKRDHLVRFLGLPSLEVESGGVTKDEQAKIHLYWKLKEAVGGEDLAEVWRLRASIAAKVGADPSFQKPCQPIRIAGSIYFKQGSEKLVTIRGDRNV